jgi:two-component system response regulator RegX3
VRHAPRGSGGRFVSSPENRNVVLVVEDEDSYLDALNVGLTIEGFSVVGAGTIAPARAFMDSARPDLVLPDIMLPDGSGLDFCRELRDSSRVPVIRVSARTSEVDVVLGLEIGAADYVTKPHRLSELVARMCAVLPRPVTNNTSEVVTFGDLRVDAVRRSVTRRGREVELSRKEFDLLSLFASRLGQVVTRSMPRHSLVGTGALRHAHPEHPREASAPEDRGRPRHPSPPVRHPRCRFPTRPVGWLDTRW